MWWSKKHKYRSEQHRKEDPRIDKLNELSREELLKFAKDCVHDWRILNEIYNNAAKRNRWCDTYETHQARYNRRFRVFRLRGRDSQREFHGEANYRRSSEHYNQALL